MATFFHTFIFSVTVIFKKFNPLEYFAGSTSKSRSASWQPLTYILYSYTFLILVVDQYDGRLVFFFFFRFYSLNVTCWGTDWIQRKLVCGCHLMIPVIQPSVSETSNDDEQSSVGGLWWALPYVAARPPYCSSSACSGAVLYWVCDCWTHSSVCFFQQV